MAKKLEHYKKCSKCGKEQTMITQVTTCTKGGSQLLNFCFLSDD